MKTDMGHTVDAALSKKKGIVEVAFYAVTFRRGCDECITICGQDVSVGVCD